MRDECMHIRKNSFEWSGASERKFIKLCYRSLNQKPPAKNENKIRKKPRAELLAERKNKLLQIARDSPDVITVHACVIYLQTYYGSERTMIKELFKYWIWWTVERLRMKAEIRLEYFYYRFIRGYSEQQWKAKAEIELVHFLNEIDS